MLTIPKNELDQTRGSLGLLDYENHGEFQLASRFLNDLTPSTVLSLVPCDVLNNLDKASIRFMELNKMVEWSVVERIIKEIKLHRGEN